VVRAKYPYLTWAQTTALCNQLVHAHFGTDHAVLHRIACELPPLMLHMGNAGPKDARGTTADEARISHLTSTVIDIRRRFC
jgi:hypothetical protein